MAVPSTGAKAPDFIPVSKVDRAESPHRGIDHFAFEECGCANPLPLWQIFR